MILGVRIEKGRLPWEASDLSFFATAVPASAQTGAPVSVRTSRNQFTWWLFAAPAIRALLTMSLPNATAK